jgi:hypothetical protein
VAGGLQLSFPFASLDFEGFTILTVDQIATKLRKTPKHILNLVEQGELVAIDCKSAGVTRRDCRIAIEAYRTFIVARLTGPAPQMRAFIHELPRAVRVELIRELKESLSA